MATPNPTRRRVVTFLKFNAMTAWLFFSIVVLGYAYSVYTSLQTASKATLAPDDLNPLIYLSLAVGCALLAYALLAVASRSLNLAATNRVVNSAPIRLGIIVMGCGALCYLVVWNASYIADNSLILYSDAPYKFLIMLTMSGTMLLFAGYVVFALFLRYRKADKRLQAQLTKSLQAGAIDVEGAVQNIDAFNWIKKFDEKSELNLLTMLSGISRLRSSMLWIPIGVINLLLFGLTAAMIVLYGTQIPLTNIANADYNLTSLAPSICWVVTVSWSYLFVDHFSCAWSLRTLTPVEKQDTAYSFLSLIYSRFYAAPEAGETVKGKRTYNIYSLAAVGPLLQLRFDGTSATVVSNRMADFADGLNRYTVLKAEPSGGKKTTVTVQTENNMYRIMLLFIFASFWSVVLFGSEVRV